VRELPIPFSTPMVQAILDGRKTMTRRVVKEIEGIPFEWGLDREPYLGDITLFEKIGLRKWDWVTHKNQWLYNLQTAVDDSKTYLLKCPYGQPGDHLYVRETWRCVKYDNMDGDLNYGVEFKDGTRKYFKFDDSERYHQFGKYALKKGWQPSIYLPKEAARIWLEITNVRVERLQEITEEDARAEGCKVYEGGYVFPGTSYDKIGLCHGSPEMAFQVMWGELYPNSDTNPWVWVISFKKVTPCS
jgi:hypothetical protein